MRFLYTGLMFLLVPYFLCRLWWKGRHSPAYRERILERFGLCLPSGNKVDIWIHAVSLGEVIAATPFIESWIRNKHGVLVTTTTPTGSERVRTYFGQQVLHQYLPYELPYALNRFLKCYAPKVVVVMETELWPNMIQAVHAKHIPLILVNGRLSERSFKKYRYLQFWFKPLLKLFSAVLVQTEADAERFKALGTPDNSIKILGNIKFDMTLPKGLNETWQSLKQQWGRNRPVLTLASTHEGEEKAFLSLLPKLQQVIPDVLLLIVPRHPERFDKVYQLSVDMGYESGRYTQPQSIHTRSVVMILDAIGELMQAYQCSDYAFVGGSLVPVGGHNVLEPIAVKVPVVSGREVHNFKAICEVLAEHNAIQLCASAEKVIEAVIHLACDEKARRQQVEAASALFIRHQGAVTRYNTVIDIYLTAGRDKIT